MKRHSLRTIQLFLIGVFLFGMGVTVRANDRGAQWVAPAAVLASNSVPAFWAVPPEAEAEGTSETRELIYKTINFVILGGALWYFLRKPLAEFFAQRSGAIRKQLDEGRKALEASQSRMAAIEGKLQHLQEEIAAFKASATREEEAERQKLRAAAAEEAEKILESGRARMETSTRAARLELRYFIAEEALKQAEQMIHGRLDEATKKQLVSQFMAKLDVKQSRN